MNINLYFQISEFNITGRPIPEDVANKILAYHLWPLNEVRHAYAQPLIISKRSCYRPYDHEITHGRDGSSEHTFVDKGACDVTGADLKLLVHLIASMTKYNRLCYYPNQKFIHIDYAGGVRRYFIDYGHGLGWQAVPNLQELILLIK